MSELYTLDANILFYAVDSTAGAKHRLAVDLVISAASLNCVLTVQALGEAYYALWRKRKEQAAEARFLLREVRETTKVIAASTEDFAEALDQHERRPVQFWDTLLWATARRHGCQTILTEDAQDRPVVGGVRYMNPFTASAKELSGYIKKR